RRSAGETDRNDACERPWLRGRRCGPARHEPLSRTHGDGVDQACAGAAARPQFRLRLAAPVRVIVRMPSRSFALLLLLRSGAAAAAEDYPARPIRAIASQGAGGLSDIWMRALGEELAPVLGQSLVVEDRMGAAGSIGARACAEAPPDGHTICILPAEP